ncbi:DUF4856 domain-containing protein [Dokdonia pacifica]|uniref:DUF4856 domain-containing protein n=1 Tax=Dokdonia pacifica TaxID=1627892 RepID=A0A239CT11_9FLAO|nr:DUF4856 domain-containing protein [Dokdonia pacifica]GGG39236.1 DUF4856 domain-containing protein [Dokdonia pacifica]SNS22523.1 protein of unknown function [Dokdonia pacifica]
MKKILFSTLAITTLAFTSCSNDDDGVIVDPGPDPVNIETPVTYSFERDGESTVSFSGQTTRILMGEELIATMLDFDTASEQLLLDMYANENTPFSSEDLNASDKNVRGKVAASQDYFSNNSAASATIKQFFADLISAQIDEVFPGESTVAEAGVPGQIADGGSTRYINSKGLEYNQAVTKGLIGALMVDQALNNYLGTAVLDAGTNIADNDNDIVAEGKPYTNMEHKWDEAYGYAYGTAADLTNPNPTIGDDDSFLNKYIGRVEGDSDFAGTAAAIFDAYKLGRAAIVAKNYEVRDEQAAILRQLISEVVGIRAVYYLQQGKNGIESNDLGGAFHDLSEGFGFIYSLQFTRNPETNAPYFSAVEVQGFIDQLTEGNGFWDVTPATLDEMSSTIANRFSFTVSQAEAVN